jgi:hypothetical protein
MPPFNFGQTFNQSLQSSLSRAQQRRAQEASRQLRLKRLRQQAEQARKDRQMQRNQFAERQENVERRLDMQKEQQEFNREQQVAQSMQQMYQNAQEARFRDRGLDIRRDRVDAQIEQMRQQDDSFMVSNDQFPNNNPLDEGEEMPLGKLPRPLQAQVVRGMLQPQRQRVPSVFQTMSGKETPGTGKQVVEDLQAPSMFPDDVQDASGVAQRAGAALRDIGEGLTLKPVREGISNFFSEDLGGSRADRFNKIIQQTAQRAQVAGQMEPQQRKKTVAQITTDLQKTDQLLSEYEQTERVKELRDQISTLQRGAAKMRPGNNRMETIMQQGMKRLAQTLQDPDASNEAVRNAFSELRKATKQIE